MATTITTTQPLNNNRKTKACFSFAAYSKDLISNLHHHSKVPVAHGLTNTELSTIESTFNFTFPPDLRSILHEGLPIGQGFPNWRSSSPQQLDILINLPILGFCKQVSRHKFWHRLWGDRPEDDDEAVELANRWLRKAPVLVPVYRNCYIPTSPCLYGNPIFYVSGMEVKVCCYDVVGLFNQIEYYKEGGVSVSGMRMKLGHFFSAPAWAATEARRIGFWTEMSELESEVRREDIGKRWWCGSELGRCLDGVRLRLRDGGWNEEDLDEMMMTSSSESETASWSCCCDDDDGGGREGVVRVLSRRLLSGGWSMGDVVETLGCLTGISGIQGDRTVEIGKGNGGDCLFDFQYMSDSWVEEGSNCQSQVLVRV